MTTNTLTSQFIIKRGINGLGIFTSKEINKGDVIFELTGNVVNTASKTSIQIASDDHIENELGALVNHSCNPNAKVDRSKRSLISIRDIKKGEEITFNYNENEDVLFSPFPCGCCGKTIAGKTQSS